MLSPEEFVTFYAAVGGKKASGSLIKLFFNAVLAGFFIASGGMLSGYASMAFENPNLGRIVGGLLFPFGLIMVIITGAELFTGNCLITISVLEKKATLLGMGRNLLAVYLGNFAGSLLLASALSYVGAFNSGLGTAVIRSAAAKCALPFGRGVILGILCNVLVCAAVMCSLCGKDIVGRAVGAFVPVSVFVIGGFEHCVANMYFIPAGMMALSNSAMAEAAATAGIDISAITIGGMLNNLASVTLGNIIGGCAFAAIIWYCKRSK